MKQGQRLVKEFKLLTAIKRYEAISEGKMLVTHFKKRLKENSLKKELLDGLDKIEKIIVHNMKGGGSIDKAIDLMIKTYGQKNPILRKYYENLELAKEERKVIDINKATA